MTDGMQGLRDDVAFMRGLAEQGRNAPLLGGSIAAAAGLLFGGTSLLTYARLAGWVDTPVSVLNWVWMGAFFLFMLVLIGVSRATRARSGRNSTANQASGAAWGGVGFAIFAIFGAFIFASARTQEWIIMTMLCPVILALYGAAWSVAGAMSGKMWMKGVAGLALVLAVATGWLAGEAEQYLLYAVALFATALIPGLVMMRQARAGAA